MITSTMTPTMMENLLLVFFKYRNTQSAKGTISGRENTEMKTYYKFTAQFRNTA